VVALLVSRVACVQGLRGGRAEWRAGAARRRTGVCDGPASVLVFLFGGMVSGGRRAEGVCLERAFRKERAGECGGVRLSLWVCEKGKSCMQRPSV
jgi:hypothetical protein